MTKVLRTPPLLETYRKRKKSLGVKLDDFDLKTLKQIKSWAHWILVQNEYPYDKIASIHHLLVPNRYFSDDQDMTSWERQELFHIKKEFTEQKAYDCLIENIKHSRTIKRQFHLHCVKYLST